MMLHGYPIFALLIAAYIVGAVPTGFIVGRLNGIHDIRHHGSGNSGATNIGRLLGTPYFFLVMLIDAAKAALCMAAINHFFVLDTHFLYIVALSLLYGNCYSFFLSGYGGKGVATYWGLLLFFWPTGAAVMGTLWVMVLLCTRISFIASLSAVFGVALLSTIVHEPASLVVYVSTIIIFLRHRTNIRQLLW